MDRAVILIQPEIGEWDWVRSRPHFPLGILQAAAKVATSTPVVFLDQRLEKGWQRVLEGHLADEEPICVALGSMSGRQIGYALAASRFVKEVNPRIPVIWGGLHASMLAEQTLAETSIDIVVRGEGEETFAQVVDALKHGQGLDGLEGVSWRKDWKVNHNPDRPFLDLEHLPEVPYHLVNVKDYLPEFRGVPSLNMETSRGCPNRCAYCYNYQYNRCTWRCQSADRVLERLRFTVDQLGVRGFYITDDNFFARKSRALDIARRIKEEELGIQWQLQGVEISTILEMYREKLDLLASSGCVRFSFGADSGSNRILERLKKNHTAEDILEVNRRLAGYDITNYYSFISGIPTETEEDLERTVDLVLTLVDENPNARVSPLYNYFPFPGAPLYQDIVASYGYQPPERLDEWERVDYGVSNIRYLSPAMRERLERLYVPTLFVDRKFHEYNTRPWLRLLSDLYRPLARYRVRKRFFRFPLEDRAARLYMRLKNPIK